MVLYCRSIDIYFGDITGAKNDWRGIYTSTIQILVHQISPPISILPFPDDAVVYIFPGMDCDAVDIVDGGDILSLAGD